MPSFQAIAFWAGTGSPLELTSSEQLEEMKTAAENMIKAGIRAGHCIPDQIARYKGQLNQWEQLLLQSQKRGGKGVYDAHALNDSEQTEWWLNVLALLRLKAIKDDENNGLLIMQTAPRNRRPMPRPPSQPRRPHYTKVHGDPYGQN